MVLSESLILPSKRKLSAVVSSDSIVVVQGLGSVDAENPCPTHANARSHPFYNDFRIQAISVGSLDIHQVP
jgi:hypothetical protein